MTIIFAINKDRYIHNLIEKIKEYSPEDFAEDLVAEAYEDVFRPYREL